MKQWNLSKGACNAFSVISGISYLLKQWASSLSGICIFTNAFGTVWSVMHILIIYVLRFHSYQKIK